MYECSCFELSELSDGHSFTTVMKYNETKIVFSFFYVVTYLSVTAIALNTSSKKIRLEVIWSYATKQLSRRIQLQLVPARTTL